MAQVQVSRKPRALVQQSKPQHRQGHPVQPLGEEVRLLPPFRCGPFVYRRVTHAQSYPAGDLLREEQKREGSEYGQLIQTYIKEGQIVPMEITIKLLENAMTAALKEKEGSEGWKDGHGSFLIDGFPRKMDQAIEFDKSVSCWQWLRYMSPYSFSGLPVHLGAIFRDHRRSDVGALVGTRKDEWQGG